ncbi:MAG: hypothetical protein HDR15_08615 [Lachnospiraceae bacterium]|nr:hypothetical protein [Lachnospiraceae bacterium]
MSKIDVRVMKLNKWYVPKTVTLGNQTDNLKQTVNPGQYIAIGYFDAVEVRRAEEGLLGEHPFIRGYKEMSDWKMEEKKNLVDFGSQEQILFTNICSEGEEGGVGFTQKSINDFWSKEADPYLFVSMVHIKHSQKLESALRRIKYVFGKDFLSYISFDYCDIVIFDKELYIKAFLEKIKKLFGVDSGQNESYIFDTFSLVSFNSRFAESNNEKTIIAERDTKMDQFSATINLSVRNHDKLMEWYRGIKKKSAKEESMKTYDMFGRHDVSIVNDRADTKWLMQMMNELHKEENHDLFWTFETYIKMEKENESTVSNGQQNDIYKKVVKALQNRVDALREVVEGSGIMNCSRFLLPVYEVRDCICSIAKNNFAEEFIYCVYDSFDKFIQYMTKEILLLNDVNYHDIVSEEKIAKSYDRYFTALNTLVNSTMHGERQFIQATAFNAIFYYVPPKIMAFYNAYVYRIGQILKDTAQSEEGHAFLIYPSFSPIVFIRKISLEDKPPCERILTVMIDEQTLYDVVSVCCQLVHEVAHYIGSDIRCRKKRWETITDALLELKICEMDLLNPEAVRVLRKYVKESLTQETLCEAFAGQNESGQKMNPLTEKAEETKKLYFSDLPAALIYFVNALKTDSEGKFYRFFDRHYNCKNDACQGSILYEQGMEDKNVQEAYIEQFQKQYKEYRFNEVMKHLAAVEDNRLYVLMLDLLESVYREAYADVQMILVLALGAEDYLNLFVRKQGVSEGLLYASEEDIIRVGTVLKVMEDCGFWEGDHLDVSDEALRKVTDHILCDMADVLTLAGQNDERVVGLNEIRKQVKTYKESLSGAIRFSGILIEEVVNENAADQNREQLKSYGVVINGLYEYLLTVVEKSLEEYQKAEKKQQIVKIREVLSGLIRFDNTVDIFNWIEEEMRNYRKKLSFENEE